MKLNKIEGVWAGTEASLQAYQDMEAQEVDASMGQPDGEELPYLFSQQGDIGVVDIKGSMSNSTSPWAGIFKMATYGAIREALIHAAADPSVKAILLDINSGGGSVNGVSDVGSLISMIDAQIKPVISFTDGTMASAAYWLGSSARAVYASNVSTVGSIGVIATHMEQSAALKAEGINVTVMRAGKFKALANSVEPLTDAAKAQMQDQLDAVYKVFVTQIAENRGQSYEWVDAHMAQGREFLGEQALTAGLVDGISTFDSVLSNISEKFIDTSNFSMDNRSNRTQWGNDMKRGMTDQSIAALAAGAALNPEAQAEIDALAQVEVEAVVEPVVEVAPVVEAAAAEAVKDDSQIVTFLQAELRERDTRLVTAQVEAQGVKDKLADLVAVHEPLLSIARSALNNMRVALGGTAVEAAQDAVTVLAEHSRLSTEFTSKFKVGGVSAVTAAAEKDEPAVDPLHKARVDATRFDK